MAATSSLRGPRHRHRHPRRPDGPALRVVQPGGRVDDPALRRHRASASRSASGSAELMGGTCGPRAAGRGRGRPSTSRQAGPAGAPTPAYDRRGSAEGSCSIVDATMTNRVAPWPCRPRMGHGRPWTPAPRGGARRRFARGDPFDVAIIDRRCRAWTGVAGAVRSARSRRHEPFRSMLLTSLSGARRTAAAERVRGVAHQARSSSLPALRRARPGAFGRERARRGSATAQAESNGAASGGVCRCASWSPRTMR